MAKLRSIDKLRQEEDRLAKLLAEDAKRHLAARKNREAAELAAQRQWERQAGRLVWDAGLHRYSLDQLRALFARVAIEAWDMPDTAAMDTQTNGATGYRAIPLTPAIP